MMSQRMRCSHCQVRRSALPLALKELNNVVINGIKYEMKEPFDPRVHGPKVGMRPERRQLPLQRCHGHVAPIS